MIYCANSIEGDRVVGKDLQRIVDVVSGKNMGVYIFGSFARGEGCFIDRPRNDYDILLVRGDSTTASAIQKAVPLAEVHLFNSPEVPCTQQWYEFKYSAKHLYGGAIQLPDWEPYEIPFADAINSLERRSVSMILGKYELMKDEPDYRKVAEQICKGIIALGDAVLIRRGEFHPSYTMRSLMLQNDEIGTFYRTAVSIKLLNEPQMNPDDLWALWVNTRSRMRQYAVDVRMRLTIGEILFSIDERTGKDELKELLIKLGAEKWL